ncbi:MAG: MCP four helix bundle domain-containing protein, partial [Rhodocyclaceae bacterium]|nr:MCP four helix bundle domain-containing protein [Rhodocyclaceae bacterium]
MKLATRLGINVAAIVAIAVAGSAVALFGLLGAVRDFEGVMARQVKAGEQVAAMAANGRENMQLVLEMFLAPDAAHIDAGVAKIDANRKANAELVKSLDELFKAPAPEAELYARARAARTRFIEARGQAIKLLKSGKLDEARKSLDQDLGNAIRDYQAALTALSQRVRSSLDEAESALAGTRQTALVTAAVALALALLLAAIATRRVARSIAGRVEHASDALREVAKGNLDRPIAAGGADEIGAMMAALAAMQRDLKSSLEAARASAEENLRIRKALDKASANVMLVGTDGKLAYANEAVTAMFAAAQADLRKVLPGFDAHALSGMRFDDFGRGAADTRSLLARLAGGGRTEIELGGHIFSLAATGVTGTDGAALGSVVEWVERTAEAAIENELSELLSAAGGGDFSRRIDLADKQGFMRTQAEGINRLVDVVSSGLQDVGRVLNAIARGVLSEKIEAEYAGTFGQLKSDANTTVERLREVVGRIKDSTEAINTAAKEIAAGNTDLSSRTEEQASSLQETASSMEELNATVRQNADNARSANELAQTSNDVAARGGEMVKQVVGTMGAIQDASRKIADIIGVIDSIAFQTNILALNA